MKKHKKSKLNPYKIFANILIVVVVAIIALDLYDCPTKLLFNFPCPGCGMTDAYFALLDFDLVKAFHHHELFPIPALWCIYLILKCVFKQKFNISIKTEMLLTILSASIFLVRWVIILFI